MSEEPTPQPELQEILNQLLKEVSLLNTRVGIIDRQMENIHVEFSHISFCLTEHKDHIKSVEKKVEDKHIGNQIQTLQKEINELKTKVGAHEKQLEEDNHIRFNRLESFLLKLPQLNDT
ncbi:MAG: hypothetical protein LBR15_00610 [Methanobrevibacter sp.]|jgi:chromosome segregation ATPase|nr:hypothetical protein [Candidatus Methanovirga australis]